jgi:hypothetical protein
MAFSGLGLHLGNLSRLSSALTRSISPENFTGEKGKGGMSVDGPAAAQARDLGQGWKVSPYVVIEPGTTFTLADIAGQGAIQQIWMTLARGRLRHSILRVYWDDQEHPSVECPAGDFFACGWEEFAQVSSLAICVNPGRAFNCYWEMPFRKRARFTLENRSEEALTVYYQINYTLTDVPEDCAYFHAQFRRTNPLPYKDIYTMLDGVSGRGNMSAPTWPGASTTMAGGAKARSSSSLTATANSRPSAAPAPRIISAARTISILMWRIPAAAPCSNPAIRNSPRPMPVCRR